GPERPAFPRYPRPRRRFHPSAPVAARTDPVFGTVSTSRGGEGLGPSGYRAAVPVRNASTRVTAIRAPPRDEPDDPRFASMAASQSRVGTRSGRSRFTHFRARSRQARFLTLTQHTHRLESLSSHNDPPRGMVP